MRDRDLFTDGDLPAWYADAACVGLPTVWWFPEKGGTTEKAVEVCEGCPVRRQCLHHAIEQGYTHGVWGGLSRGARDEHRRRSRAA